MAPNFDLFELAVRRANLYSGGRSDPIGASHPFDARNIHPKIQEVCRELFDNGHYSQATFEAYKYIDKHVSTLAEVTESGFKLMMRAFSKDNPLIFLSPMSSISETDEQEGYKFIFSGSVMAIRNPRGHEYGVQDSLETCLDHLSLASLLERRLDSRLSPF